MLVALFLDDLWAKGCILKDDYNTFTPIYINPETKAECVIDLTEDRSQYRPIQVAMYCDTLQIARPSGYESYPSISQFMDIHEQVKDGKFEKGSDLLN